MFRSTQLVLGAAREWKKAAAEDQIDVEDQENYGDSIDNRSSKLVLGACMKWKKTNEDNKDLDDHENLPDHIDDHAYDVTVNKKTRDTNVDSDDCWDFSDDAFSNNNQPIEGEASQDSGGFAGNFVDSCLGSGSPAFGQSHGIAPRASAAECLVNKQKKLSRSFQPNHSGEVVNAFSDDNGEASDDRILRHLDNTKDNHERILENPKLGYMDNTEDNLQIDVDNPEDNNQLRNPSDIKANLPTISNDTKLRHKDNAAAQYSIISDDLKTEFPVYTEIDEPVETLTKHPTGDLLSHQIDTSTIDLGNVSTKNPANREIKHFYDPPTVPVLDIRPKYPDKTQPKSADDLDLQYPENTQLERPDNALQTKNLNNTQVHSPDNTHPEKLYNAQHHDNTEAKGPNSEQVKQLFSSLPIHSDNLQIKHRDNPEPKHPDNLQEDHLETKHLKHKDNRQSKDVDNTRIEYPETIHPDSTQPKHINERKQSPLKEEKQGEIQPSRPEASDCGSASCSKNVEHIPLAWNADSSNTSPTTKGVTPLPLDGGDCGASTHTDIAIMFQQYEDVYVNQVDSCQYQPLVQTSAQGNLEEKQLGGGNENHVDTFQDWAGKTRHIQHCVSSSSEGSYTAKDERGDESFDSDRTLPEDASMSSSFCEPVVRTFVKPFSTSRILDLDLLGGTSDTMRLDGETPKRSDLSLGGNFLRLVSGPEPEMAVQQPENNCESEQSADSPSPPALPTTAPPAALAEGWLATPGPRPGEGAVLLSVLHQLEGRGNQSDESVDDHDDERNDCVWQCDDGTNQSDDTDQPSEESAYLETHFWYDPSPTFGVTRKTGMVDSLAIADRGLDGSENKWTGQDGGSMEGVVVSHQHTCSQDSSDSGSLPPTYSRLPPDGHEFPEDYVDPSFHGFHDFGKSGVCADQEFLSRKSSASSTASLDRHEFKMTIAGKKYATSEDRVSGVRAKIAMFSNGTSAKPGASKPVLGKFQSSEDVGKLSNGGNGSLTRAHTHGDVRFDDGLKKQGSQSSIKSLTSLNGSRSDHVGGQKGKIYSNLKPQNKSTSFRSMINVSSTTRESPTSPDDKSVSIVDLTKSTDNLIRSHEVDSVIREEPEKKSRVAAPSINNRSQSLMEITNNTLPKRPDVGSQGRSRSSNLIGQATIEEARKNSLTSLMAGRRSTTMSKLKGLVIPEAKESNTGENNMTQPSTGHKEKISATNEKTLRTSQNKMGGGTLPNPPWKEKNSNDFPKYSPAFKRKQFSVYLTGNSSRPASIGGTSQASAGNQNQDGRSTSPKLPANVESKPMNGAHTADHVTESSDSSKKQVTEQLAYKPPIGKRNSDDGNHQTHRTEDSDNDSAVSSGRSSLSGRSATPPTSPNRGRKNSDEKNVLDKNQNSKKGTPENPRVLKKHSIEAINRRNVLMSCKKSSANTPAINDIQTAITGEELKKAELTDPPLETSSPRNSRTLGRPASRSSSFTIAERKKSFESSTKVSETSSRRGSNSSQDSLSRRSSRENFDLSRRSSREAQEDLSSRRTSKEDHVITPTRSYNMYPNSILDIEEKVAYMTDVVDRASPTTPTDRRSLSRTNSMASERSTYSSKSSRNSSIICEKTPFGRNNSILSKDSAISEDIGRESSVGRELTPEAEKDNLPHKKTSSTEDSSRWSELEKKYNKGISAGSLENKMSKFVLNEHSPPNTTKNERPKELVFSPKKISNGKSSPGSKNFKELAEKWQIRTLETPTSPQSVLPTVNTLPRKNSKEKIVESPIKTFEDAAWSPTSSMQTSYYTPTGETDWPGFHIDNGFSKADIPDRKFSVPAFSNEKSVKLRDKKDNVPSRPSSLIESSDQKDLKIFEIGNLGDNNRLMLNSNSTSQSSSQADLLDSNSITSDTPKSPLPSSSSREILDVFSKGNNRRAVSVNDIRRAFEKAELSLSNIGIGSSKRSDMSTPSSHNRMSSLDSTTSEESSIPTPHFYGSVSSLTSGHTGLKDHYGSITSLASSTSMISPQELQNLIDEANQSLEESGTPSHEIMVIVLHREFSGGSIGITLAGGADYESKEITVHKVIAGSLADRDGRIQKGDRVLSINGRSIKGVSHREALSILKAPRPEVVLVVSRSRSVTPAERAYGVGISVDDLSFNYINSSRPPKILESPLDHKSLMADLKFVDVPRGPPITVTLKKEGTGLGFSLEGGKDSPYGDRPMTIKKIFTGGAADKNGVLKVGDAIMSVNTADCTRMTRLEAWNYMKKLNDGMASVIVRQKLDPCHKQQPVPIVKAELVVDDPMEKSP